MCAFQNSVTYFIESAYILQDSGKRQIKDHLQPAEFLQLAKFVVF